MNDPLSPAAQAVLDAVCANTEPDCDTQHLIAAALLAAAQVIADDEMEHYALYILRDIAADLEGADG